MFPEDYLDIKKRYLMDYSSTGIVSS